MLLFCFFITVFASASWLIYALMFVSSKLAESRLWEQSPEQMLLMLSVVFLPILIIWIVFGFINQFITNRGMNIKQNELLNQLQKNQDYTDLVVRVMLDAEHEIKDGFVLNKFDLFVSDMNESLSEIIQRCNIASSAQLEQLWQRVKRGERWVLGKAILDAGKSQSTFNAWVAEKINRDKVFRGTMLEFCSRYQNLLQLLEKHDRDKIFLRIIETGVFGKVYSIIAPLSEGISGLSATPADKAPQSQTTHDYSSVLKIATMEEPKASETIINVDKNDNEDENTAVPAPKRSLFSRLNPFGNKEEYEEDDDEHEQDPFFRALHNSFQSDDSLVADKVSNSFKENTLSLDSVSEIKDEPSLSSPSMTSEIAPSLSSAADDSAERRTPTFGGTRSTLDNLRSSNNSFSFSTDLNATKENSVFQNKTTEKPLTATADTPQKTEEKEEDLAYPFGGWTDEDNYR